MPMIDVYAAAGTFPDSRALAQDLAAAVVRWEQVPDSGGTQQRRNVSERMLQSTGKSTIDTLIEAGGHVAEWLRSRNSAGPKLLRLLARAQW